MSIILQNILALTLVAACALFILRSAHRALSGRKSGLSGCGACSGCATPAPKTDAKPTAERVVMVPMDALIRSSQHRSKSK